MAGLLDSDFMRFLTNNQSFWERRDQAEAAQKFGGLLGTLEEQGPVQPGGVLGMRAPDQQFWLQAAQIPGYQSLAGQQLGYGAAGQQAMQRQMQQQRYEKNNLTMAQDMAQRLNEAKAFHGFGIAEQDLARKWAGTNASMASSYASAGSSNASRELTLSKLFEQNRKNAEGGGVLYSQLTPKDRVAANKDMQAADTFAAGGIDVADWAANRGSGSALPLVGTAEGDAMMAEWRSTIRPMMQNAMQLGALQGEEGEMLDKLIKRPDDYVLTKSDLNVIQTMAQKAQDYRKNTYQAYGIDVPDLPVGRSAVSRTLNKAKPVGKVRPVTAPVGGDGSIWYPVQR